ncbi:hypothetical protein Tco_1581645 [Tanacetum coccineum]
MKNWRSANKFSVLEDIEDAEIFYGTKKSEHEIVDKFVDYQRQPIMEDSKDWCSEMFKECFKWNGQCSIKQGSQPNTMFPMNVLNAELRVAFWNVRGMCNKDMQRSEKIHSRRKA